LDEHELWLGRSVPQCLAALAPDAPLELDDASSGFLAALDTSWVAVTVNGVAGDSGMASPAYYLLLAGDDLARLCDRYGTYRSSRALVRATRRTTLCDSGFFMAPSCCIDERVPLPPFFPVQRNSDAVFAAMLRCLTPSALIAHLPSVVEHRPEPPRRFVEGVFFTPEHAFTSDFMLQACYAFEAPKWFSEAERAEAFVQYLRSLGRLTSAEFADFFRVERLKQLARLSQRLSEQYTQATLPELRIDIERELTRIQAAVRGPLELSPQDFPGTGAGSLERIQGLLVDFAAIVEAWPTLLDAARALHSSGRTFALPLAAP
jgi:hypothetical protein